MYFKVNNSIKLASSRKIQTWYICILAVWIPSSTWQYLLCNFYGWMWSSAYWFLSVLWWRGVYSICWQLKGEFCINSTAWDFYSLYRLSKKPKRKLRFLFVGKGKRFIMELFIDEFNPIFFTVESAWPVLNATKAATFWRILKKNYKMCPDWRWRDFLLKFAVCSADLSILA